MADEGFKRKLTAILSADAVEYSRLMSENEEATVSLITSYREVLTTLIQQHNGNVLDSPGDNLLAEFASVVDAVQCAVAVQKEIKARNDELPENRRMQFRIGINLGDVIQEEERIYGDGVNIAARLEGLSEPGGICISKTAFEHIESKLPYGYEFLGDQTVKNISKPVAAYRVLMEPRVTIAGEPEKNKLLPIKHMPIFYGIAAVVVLAVAIGIWLLYSRPTIEPVSVEKMAFPLPEKPSIAVLPFKNLSGDPSQDYIGLGISENIISALSNISDMFVIYSGSTSTYKGKSAKIQKVSEELGVRYVLEGSAQKSGNRVRVTTQLIDATTGHCLWSEKYDRELQNLFSLQDEITHKVIVELQVTLTEGEQARVSQMSTTNLEAWSYANRGLALWMRPSKENNTKAMEHFKKAVEIDPNYIWAWVRLAWTHRVALKPGWSQLPPSEHLKKVVEISERVLALDEPDSDVHALLGLVYRQQGKYEQAITQGEKSIILGPTNAQSHVLHAVSMNIVGRFDEAIELVKRAMRLHPYYPAYYLPWLGSAYRMTGRYEDALSVYNQLLDRSRNGEYPVLVPHLYLADIYSELGKEEAAQAHAAQVIKINPGFSLNDVRVISTFEYKNQAHLERRLNALHKAGLPEYPPLELPDKPSIVVLPFVNMSNDPDQEYFSDGMTDELISDLAKIKDILVISRNSAFTYKGKSIKIQQVAQELNVRYILEGSVQRSGNKVRIRAQLIDGKTDHHLWSESYDGVMDDIFALQDKITAKIVTALSVTLTTNEQDRIADKGTNSIPAYEAYLKGLEHYSRMTGDDLIKAITYYRKATEIDPSFSRAYSGLAAAYNMSTTFWYPWESQPKIIAETMKFKIKARHYLKLAMQNPTWEAYVVKAYMDIALKRFDEAVASAEKALIMAPNEYLANIAMGHVLNSVGRASEALKHLDTAMRLDPRILDVLFVEKGKAFFIIGDYDKAVTFIQKGLTLNPELTNYASFEAASQAFLGNIIEAKDAWQRFLEGFPLKSFLSTKYLYYFFSFKDHRIFERFINGLNKAGFEGNPSDYYRVEKNNRLSGQKIKRLLFGKSATGYSDYQPGPVKFSYRWTAEGNLEFSTPSSLIFDKGKSQIEEDSICNQFESLFDGKKACMDVYYIIEGNDDAKNQYLFIGDYALRRISVKE